MAAPLTINTARIPSGDSPVCGVCLEPYVVVRRGDQNIDAKDCAEEGSGDARFSLRFRWYRSTVNKGGAVCFFHQVTGPPQHQYDVLAWYCKPLLCATVQPLHVSP